jgi:hypothetical protein
MGRFHCPLASKCISRHARPIHSAHKPRKPHHSQPLLSSPNNPNTSEPTAFATSTASRTPTPRPPKLYSNASLSSARRTTAASTTSQRISHPKTPRTPTSLSKHTPTQPTSLTPQASKHSTSYPIPTAKAARRCSSMGSKSRRSCMKQIAKHTTSCPVSMFMAMPQVTRVLAFNRTVVFRCSNMIPRQTFCCACDGIVRIVRVSTCRSMRWRRGMMLRGSLTRCSRRRRMSTGSS